jgi:hypothetical protein
MPIISYWTETLLFAATRRTLWDIDRLLTEEQSQAVAEYLSTYLNRYPGTAGECLRQFRPDFA